MDFQSAMETFAEAWVVANAKNAATDPHQNEALSLTCSPPSPVDRGLKLPPAGMFGKDPAIEGKPPTDKSLPVHCVVETVLSLEDDPEHDRSSWRRKSLVETDSYVIIPVNTPIHDLLLVALTRLGYPKETTASAKGAILIRNWRPLSFDAISPSPLVTVGELLGELSTIATLRIQILRPKSSLVQEMKEKLLKLLLIQSHAVLMRSGCPLDSLALSNLCRESSTLQHASEPSEELRAKFDAWVTSQLNSPSLHQVSPPFPNTVLSRMGPMKKESDVHSSPLHAQLTQKTRMRTSFDPELELPKLQKWFHENQHPSRQQIQQYVKELNSLECRRGRKPLDINNVVYWFKNARAAQKRAELRGGFYSPMYNMGVNGFQNFHNPARSQVSGLSLSEHQSVSDDELSRASDIEDNGPPIDVNDSDTDMPLSLTTNNNKRNAADMLRDEKGELETHRIKDEPTEDVHKDLISHSVDNTNKLETRCNSIDNNAASQDRMESPKPPNCADDELEGHNNNNNNNIVIDESFTDEEDGHDDGRTSLDLRKNCSDDIRSPSPSGGPLPRLPPGFPLVPNSMFSHSIMYMSHYMPGLGPMGSPRDPALLLSQDERRKRNRTFIDPVTEVPRLEQWFSLNTHPSHNLILKYTEELNRMPYRQKFPRLEPKNVQFWFKNRRAKCKRLKMSLFDGIKVEHQIDSQPSHYPAN